MGWESLFEQKGEEVSLKLYMELYTFGSDDRLEKEALARNISTATITEVIIQMLKAWRILEITAGSFEKVWLKYIHSVKYAYDYV